MRRLLLVTAVTSVAFAAEPPIDRHALVTRHNPVIRQVDPEAPLTVGNGGFAFTVDVTGRQTFAEHYYRHGLPPGFPIDGKWVIRYESLQSLP